MAADEGANECPLCCEQATELFALPCCKKELCSKCLCKSTVNQVTDPKCSFCTKGMSAQKNSVVIMYSMNVCSNDNWKYDPGLNGCTNPDCADYQTSVFSGQKRSYKAKTERFHEVFTFKLLDHGQKGASIELEMERLFGFGSGITMPVRFHFLHPDGKLSAHSQRDGLIPHADNKWAPKWAPFIPSVQAASIPRVRDVW